MITVYLGETWRGALIGGIYSWPFKSMGVRASNFHRVEISSRHSAYRISNLWVDPWTMWVWTVHVNWKNSCISIDLHSSDQCCSGSAVLPELQCTVLAHVEHSCSFPAVDLPRVCKQSFELSLPVFQDILLTIFLSASLQLEVHSRSYNGCFIWKPYQRNLHWHSVSGCVGNSETSDFTFKFIHS